MLSKLVYLVLAAVQLASQQSIYYVIPGDSASERVCHPGNAHCSTLINLLQHITARKCADHSSCLLDTRIVLLPGVHDVSGYSNILFSVNCSKKLVLTALDPQVGSTISCSGLTGFAFTHATNLSIHGLTFENCEFLSTQHLQMWHISLSVEYAMDIDINNVVIRGSQEIGLFIGNYMELLTSLNYTYGIMQDTFTF